MAELVVSDGSLDFPAIDLEKPDPQSKPGSPLRILLVEDSSAYADLTREMLQSASSVPFQLDHATSARGAVNRLAGDSYDIVLLDLGLPDAQGLEALNGLVGAMPDLPIVILSGTENEALALEAVKSGAQDYLIKGQATPDLLVRSIRYAIERKQSELQIKQLAYYDSLTLLPNRRLLMEHLGLALRRAVRNGSVVGVLFIDIDHFKQINDTLGHAAGDSVLKQIAARLSSSFRKSDTLARLSGDEFVAIVEVRHPRELVLVAGNLHEHLKAPFTTANGQLFTTASIGVSSSQTGGTEAEELLRNADRAMYRAKAEGRDTVRFCAAPLEATRSTELTSTNTLRRAVEH